MKTDRQEGVQGGFGHDPRNAPAFFQWREVEIWFMEEGVQMYKFHNSSRTEKINLDDSLPDINKFVREYVRRYDKWRNKSSRDTVEDFSFDAYIAHQSGNSTLQLPGKTRWQVMSRSWSVEAMIVGEARPMGMYIPKYINVKQALFAVVKMNLSPPLFPARDTEDEDVQFLYTYI